MSRTFFFALLALVACATKDVSAPQPSSSQANRTCMHAITIGEGLEPRAMNRRGVVVGKGPAHAFVWSGYRAVELPGAHGAALALNDRGTIVGTAEPRDGAQPHAVRWRDGLMEDLGTLGGTYSKALDVNDRGEIVGYAATREGRSHAFIWRDGTMTDLGTLGGTESGATGMNERGQVIGWSLTARPVEWHAFLWDAGKMIDLGKAWGAVDINERGDVIMQAHLQAAFWRDGVLTEVAPFENATITFLHGMDENGRVVGSTVTSGREVGFRWANGVTTAIDVEGSSGWVTAIAMNAHGVVVGFAEGSAGGRAFAWRDGALTFLAGDEENSIAIAIDDAGRIVGTSGTKAMLWTIGACETTAR